MTWYFPFIFLGVGILLGLIKLKKGALHIIDYIGNTALVILMFTIGISVGSDDVVIKSIGIIGIQCVVIALSAIFFSVLVVFILEKTVLPLNKLKEQLASGQAGINGIMVTEAYQSEPAAKQISEDNKPEKEQKRSSLVWIIPLCIVLGVAAGFFVIPKNILPFTDKCFLVSLAVLYVIGDDKFGARNWLTIGNQSVQPSEFVKVGLVFVLAHWLTKSRQVRDIWPLLVFVVVTV